MRSVLAAVAVTENATLQDGNSPMIKRSTLAAVVVPFVLAACQQGGAPGTVLATSLSDGQIQACANEVAAQSAFDRSLLSTVYGGEAADGNGLVRVTAPNGNIFLCEVDSGYRVQSVTISQSTAG
jgi:hypothetical protein